MKKYKPAALLLTLVLLLGIFAGCAKTEVPAAEPAAEPEIPAAEPAPAPAEQGEPAVVGDESPVPSSEPEPDLDEPAAQPATPGEEQSLEPDENGLIHYLSGGGMQYPVGDGTQELSLWYQAPRDDDPLNSYNEAYILPHLRAATGVNLTFTEVSPSAMSEQFQLMIASGSYTDLLDVSMLYSGGLAQAYVDEVIMDLTDLLPANAPDYWTAVEALDDTSYASLITNTDAGDQLMLGFRTISSGSYTTGGYCVRGDYLAETGRTVEDMSTIDGFTDVLYTVQENHPDAEWNLLMKAASTVTNCVAWDASIPDITSTSSVATYLVDGQVRSGWVADEYYDYLVWFRQLYADGIINPDYYTRAWASSTDTLMEVASGSVFCWANGMDVYNDVNLYAEAPIEVLPLGFIYADENHINNWGQELGRVSGMSCISVTDNCEDIELALQFLNYHYTERGLIQGNYGVEGETYTMNAEGEPEYTDLVLNSDFISNMQSAVKYYTIGAFLPIYNYEDKLFASYGPEALDAVHTWTAAYDSTEHSFPTDFYLTTEETASVTNQIVDCCTFGQEQILKFIYGQTPLNEDTWKTYVDGFYSYGLQHVLDVNQEVLEATLAGTRAANPNPAPPSNMPPPPDAPQ